MKDDLLHSNKMETSPALLSINLKVIIKLFSLFYLLI